MMKIAKLGLSWNHGFHAAPCRMNHVSVGKQGNLFARIGGAVRHGKISSACNSMYEVKSKATPEKVEKTFKFNNISAGSLERFCHLYNSPKKPDQKMFILILPRETH